MKILVPNGTAEVISLPRLCREVPIDRRTLRRRLAVGLVKPDFIDPERGVLFLASRLNELREVLIDSMDHSPAVFS